MVRLSRSVVVFVSAELIEGACFIKWANFALRWKCRCRTRYAVGIGPPPPPFPSYDEIQRKYVWSSWQSWSGCSETCGFGTRTRMRSCSRPTRICEKFLDTKASETRRCREQPCGKNTLHSLKGVFNWFIQPPGVTGRTGLLAQRVVAKESPSVGASVRAATVLAAAWATASAPLQLVVSPFLALSVARSVFSGEKSECRLGRVELLQFVLHSGETNEKTVRTKAAWESIWDNFIVNALSSRRNARHLRWRVAHARCPRGASLCAL